MKLKLNRRKCLRVSEQSAVEAGLVGMACNHSAAKAAEHSVKAMDAASITSLIVDYTATAPTNSLRNTENEKAWDEPLARFSRGEEGIYQFLGKISVPSNSLGCPQQPMAADFVRPVFHANRGSRFKYCVPSSLTDYSANSVDVILLLDCRTQQEGGFHAYKFYWHNVAFGASAPVELPFCPRRSHDPIDPGRCPKARAMVH